MHDLLFPATQMPQTRQMNQLLTRLEEAKRREREFEQECDHLRQIEAEMSRELSSSKEKTEVSSGNVPTSS